MGHFLKLVTKVSLLGKKSKYQMCTTCYAYLIPTSTALNKLNV
jgi:hypothetical protein